VSSNTYSLKKPQTYVLTEQNNSTATKEQTLFTITMDMLLSKEDKAINLTSIAHHLSLIKSLNNAYVKF